MGTLVDRVFLPRTLTLTRSCRACFPLRAPRPRSRPCTRSCFSLGPSTRGAGRRCSACTPEYVNSKPSALETPPLTPSVIRFYHSADGDGSRDRARDIRGVPAAADPRLRRARRAHAPEHLAGHPAARAHPPRLRARGDRKSRFPPALAVNVDVNVNGRFRTVGRRPFALHVVTSLSTAPNRGPGQARKPR